MNKALVSIVTPVFNQEKYIEKTIKSVLAQTYSNIEYIVIDDGSYDGTKEILDRYKSLITVVSQDNAGQSAALNHGWRLSNGSILGYISADDLLSESCIEDAVAALSDNSQIICTYCDFTLIDHNGSVIRDVITDDYSAKKLNEDLICLPGPGAFFLKDAFNSIGGWQEELEHIPDFEFWLRLSKIGEFQRIPKVLASFRVHADSGSVKKVSEKRSNEICLVMREFCNTNYTMAEDSKKRCLSNASAISARSHLQSGRYIQGLMKAYESLKYDFNTIFRVSWYRLLLTSLIRRILYNK